MKPDTPLHNAPTDAAARKAVTPVICYPTDGLARPDLAPSTEAEFRKHGKLKLVDAEDMGPGEGALRPDQLAAAISASSK